MMTSIGRARRNSIAAIAAMAGVCGQARGQSSAVLPFIESGHGPAVVLVHGALGDQRQWKAMADILDERHRVISMSRRCHWPRPCAEPMPAYTYDSHSDDLRAFLRSLGEPAHLIGHSYGAAVVLLTALRSPEMALTVTLIEPPFGSLVPASAPGFAEELASRNAMTASVRARAGAGDSRAASEMLIDWVQGGAGGFRRLPADAQEMLLDNASTVAPTVGAPSPVITCESVGRLRRPVLALHGERTRTWYRLAARAAADCIPGAAIATVDGGGHMIVVENPAGTARAIAAFITREDSRPRR